MNFEESTNRICIGRFEFAIPAGLRIEGRSQSIYRVDVHTVDVPYGAVDARWVARVSAVRSMAAPPGAKDRIIRTYDLQPGTRAVWLYDNSEFTDVLRLEAWRPVSDHIFVASTSGDDERQSVIETLVQNVVNAYAPEAREGFCVEHGTVTSEPGHNESTASTFKHTTLPNFEMNFITQTVKDPAPSDELSDRRELDTVLGARGAQITSISSASRVAARLDGFEERFSVVPKTEPPFVRFSWKYPGQPLRGDTPQITVIAVAPKEQQVHLTLAWEQLLGSLKPVPMAKVGR